MTFKEEFKMALEHEKEVVKEIETKQKEFDKLPIETKMADQYLKTIIVRSILGLK